MTRLWQPALSIRVLTIDDTPVSLTWNGRQFQVDHIAIRWRRRVWWRGIWREYYKLVTHSGQSAMLVVIYRDLNDNDWYLQEIYD